MSVPRSVVNRFNPRPTRGQAETRASARSSRSDGFQSTAHPRAGRNATAFCTARSLNGFNPRPTRGQAETHSVRLPLTSPRSFQSTAHPRAGRNRARTWQAGRPGCFNPRPTRGQAETTVPAYVLGSHSRGFNPRPTRGQAETQWCFGGAAPESMFQSTAHPRAGRNPTCGRRRRSSPPVSIHGPPEGRPKRGHRRGHDQRRGVSIHGPPEGRPKRGGARHSQRPAPVSIHGPPEGRPKH